MKLALEHLFRSIIRKASTCNDESNKAYSIVQKYKGKGNIGDVDNSFKIYIMKVDCL